MNHRISAIVPTYNSERIIGECLDSLAAQTRPFDEIILVDNASTDGTRQILERHPYKKMLLGKNVERCNSRNIGWQAAKGELVAIIENDSVFDKDWVKNVLESFDAGADAVIDQRRVHKPETFIARLNDEYYRVRLNPKTYKPFSAWVFRKEVLERLGGFDPAQVGAEDGELGARILKAGYKILYQQKAIQYHAGEPKTLKEEWRRRAWFGFRALKFYGKHPDRTPCFSFALSAVTLLSLLYLPAFLLLFFCQYAATFAKVMRQGMRLRYALAFPFVAITGNWIYFLAVAATAVVPSMRK